MIKPVLDIMIKKGLLFSILPSICFGVGYLTGFKNLPPGIMAGLGSLLFLGMLVLIIGALVVVIYVSLVEWYHTEVEIYKREYS